MAVFSRDSKKMASIERGIAKRSDSVFSHAGAKHMEMGHTIVVSQGNKVVRIGADGSSELVKKIEAPRQYVRGTKFKLR